MANDVAGSNRKLTIDGISYRVAADANFSETFTKFENDVIATSGSGMKKKTKRIQRVEGVVLLTNAAERIELEAAAESIDDLKLSYQNAAGDEYKSEGTIEIEGNETEENRTSVTLLPTGDWTPFVA